MCEAKPGVRCAADSRDATTTSAAAYLAAFPAGPPVNPCGPTMVAYGDGPGGFVAPTLADPDRLRVGVKPLKVAEREAAERAQAAAPPIATQPTAPPVTAQEPRWEPQTTADWRMVEAMYAERERRRPTPSAAFWGAPAPVLAARATTAQPPAPRWSPPATRVQPVQQTQPHRSAVAAGARAGGRALTRELRRGGRRGARRLLVAPIRRALRKAVSPRWWRQKFRAAFR